MTDSTANDPVVSNPTWTGDIKAFFTLGDIACMQPMGIDLSSYDGVKQNAEAIYEQTSSGNMPQGGPRWSANRVQTFKNWLDNGYPEGSSGQQGGGATPAPGNGDPLVAKPTWTGNPAPGGNIQQFFTQDEIQCMNYYRIVDLSNYESVKARSTDVFEQTASGNMPQGGPRWSDNKVQTFLNWINTGCPEQPAGGAAEPSGGAGDDPVVQHPTYMGDIRFFFTPRDIACMKPRGIDLSTYAGVKSHASNIYVQTKSGNMPLGGPRWSANRVQTFMNWIVDKYPQGSAQSAPGEAAAPSANARLRKNVNSLSQSEIDLLKQAFRGIMALDPADSTSPVDPNSYFGLAAVHGLPLGFCMHHVDTYNPWHRVYITRFEDALRSVPGCEDVTMPYWDITEPAIPALFGEPPFDSYVVKVPINDPNYTIPYTTERHKPAVILEELKGFQVTDHINDAMSAAHFGTYQTGGYSKPVMKAHDSGHLSCGPTMADQDVAAYDPIFWFFHCNWERVFWSWQKVAGATTLSGFTSTLAGDTDWLDLALDPYPDTTAEVIPYTQVTYEKLDEGAAAVLKSSFGHVDADRTFTIPHSAPVSVRVKDINRMNIPGSFVVHLLADGEPVAKQAFFQPKVARNCTNCQKQALVGIDFKVEQEKIQGKALSVSIEVPSLGEGRMGAFPLSSAGNPTINARLLLEEA